MAWSVAGARLTTKPPHLVTATTSCAIAAAGWPAAAALARMASSNPMTRRHEV
eukprot:CAMPEP_0202086376 /NCGR_PEP_ID=MMETSP0964-20121228/33319_1 /ASSEMBLY_ACC=CAM_ASM_000500 /TAXON_ID=4773 /ORGANISM="Schizochytrium aggregatum, Strain ATCC28209" /LENGTH=52 /DNA_ID=CAMNT_0048654269 /DNA_START=171 /DNA_END=329 /DNA_ORIENTATION=-